MRSPFFDPLRSFRRRAKLLHGDLFSAVPATALGAAARIVRVRKPQPSDVAAVLARRDEIRLRDALDAIAREAGHESWSALARQAALLVATEATPVIDADALFRQRGGMAQGWFSTHAAGREALRPGLALLPYGTQSALVDKTFLASLGFDQNDRDLRALGPDWTMPRDAYSWHRVAVRLALHGCSNASPKRPIRLPARVAA